MTNRRDFLIKSAAHEANVPRVLICDQREDFWNNSSRSQRNFNTLFGKFVSSSRFGANARSFAIGGDAVGSARPVSMLNS